MELAIIDYGMGNIKSVCNAFRFLGAEPTVVRKPSALAAEKIVIPGVGAFGDGARNIAPFVPRIKGAVASRTPVLGICLGMHLLFEGSEESPGAGGIGILKGRVVRLRTRQRLPHIGWNSIRIRKECPLFRGVNGEFMYFVHSYHPRPEENITVATARYGCVVTAGICSGNVYGTQFHPEKSGEAGLRVLKNFLEL